VITRDAAHRYTYEGVTYPGVTTVLTAIKGSAFRSEAYKAAGVLGTQVHALAEYVVRGELVPFDGGSDKAMLYARNYAQWWKSSGWTLRLSEAMLLHPSVGYGGTFDLLARDSEGRTVLADIKTGSKVDKAAILQLTAYGMAPLVQPADSDRQYPMPIPDRYVVLHVTAEAVREVEIEVGQAERMAFLDCVDLHLWLEAKKGLKL